MNDVPEAGNDNKRRRLLIVTQLFPNNAHAFLGTFVVNQLRHLQSRYEIIVLTDHAEPLMSRGRQRQATKYNHAGMIVYSVRSSPAWLTGLELLHIISASQAQLMNKRLVARRLLRVAKELHDQQPFDLVHGHESYLGDEAADIAAKLDIPTVFTLHGLFEYHLEGFGRPVMNAVLANLRQFKHIIAVSHVAAETYLRQGLRPESLTIIPNGIELPVETTADTRIINFAHGRFVFASIGWLVPAKRVAMSIQTLADIRSRGQDAVLVIVGQGVERERLESLSHQLGVSSHILWLEEVPPTELIGIYAAIDVLLHPSVVESFSMVCLEAMAQSKPVICTSNIGLTEYIAAGRDLVVIPPDDQNALTKATLELLGNSTKRIAMAQAARVAATKLTAKNTADQVATVYDHVIAT